MNRLKQWLRHVQFSDLRSAAQLATSATRGVTDIVAGVHHAVLDTLPGQPTAGPTRLVYRSIYGVQRLVALALDQTLGALEPWLARGQPETNQRAAVLAALNGVLGDRLQAADNALATTMSLRGRAGAALSGPPWAGSGGKLVLLIHGLCMNDVQWQLPAQNRAEKSTENGVPDASAAIGADLGVEIGVDLGVNIGVDIGAELAKLGYTPLYLRYNSGLHISENGQQLAQLLQHLFATWPEPITELTLIGHSMGGLVARSACAVAEQAALPWRAALRRMIFLGTPHHGAPLERAGNWVDVILATTPYSAPFAKLGQLRSSGITDLRYGFVQASDWHGENRFTRRADSRQPLPLPSGVACHAVAATLAARGSVMADSALGDGLVPLASALGQSADPEHCLQFSSTLQLWQTGHMALLYAPEVGQAIRQWLAAAAPSAPSTPTQ